MKFSEAMRLGSMLKPQGFGLFQADDGVHSCANAAAKEAVGKTGFMEQVFPDAIYRGKIVCPECQFGDPDSVFGIVANHLNDRHLWTRERIADWVEQIEQGRLTAAKREQEDLVSL